MAPLYLLTLLTTLGCGYLTPEQPEADQPAKGSKRGKQGKASKAHKAPAQPAAPKPSAKGKPNVLLVIWDTVRSDHLTPYGYALDTTPRLAELAAESIVYERAISPGMWTIPSHASIFTGIPVSGHGAKASHKWLDERFITMAEWLGQHGWDSYLFSANPFVSKDTNMSQGFDRFEAPWSKRWRGKTTKVTQGKILPDDASNPMGPKYVRTEISSGREADKSKDAGPVTAEALGAWLDSRERKDEPFFATLNYMEAHVPRLPSLEARQALFNEDEIAAQLSTDQDLTVLLAHTVGVQDFSAERIATVATTYDASLRDLDTSTGALFDLLQERGILDDTIVIVTSDHGEHLGEHHRFGHKYSVYNPLIHVPLIVRYPKGLQPARVSTVVSTLDIFATVTELAGLELPAGTSSHSLLHPDELPGQAFSELMEPTPQALKRISKIAEFSWEPFMHLYATIEAADHKCIARSDGHRELYAQPADFLETNDLALTEPDTAETLCGRIDTWRSTFAVYDPRAASSADESTAGGDAKLQERLKALGYLDEPAE